jgi:hypothetical protein
MTNNLTKAFLAFMALLHTATAQYQGWKHSGSFFLLTTPEGANLPATASLEGFPLLLRLDKDCFDFKQAQGSGEDLRFAAGGKPLAYQIDNWDATAATAAIWVRIPNIMGNSHQKIDMFWGKPDAKSESNGKAVFNETNGYLGVFHLDDPVVEETGGIEAKDQGTTTTSGVIGQGRRFEPGKGIHCGDNITTFPTGSSPHSTEVWFKAKSAGDRIVCWGNGEPKAVVQLILSKPPRMSMDCYGSGAGLAAESSIPTSEWVHVIHTCQKGDSRIYVNGRLDGVSTNADNPLDIKSPSRMWLGGWGGYVFNGDMDEVRISKVARSADWVKLQYENQKPLQTVVGPLVRPGGEFAVSEKSIQLLEGKSITVQAKAGGAEKLYWIIKRDGVETIAAADRFAYTLDAGRVTGDASFVLQLKAVFAKDVKTLDIPVSVKEDQPDPVFSLQAPATWNGRDPIEVVPQITNLPTLQTKGAADVKTRWSLAGPAVIVEEVPGKLILQRSQNSGKLTVTATITNGGNSVTQSIPITVAEPAKEIWVQRTPEIEDKPVDNQFFARDDNNEGTLYYNGALTDSADAVFLKLYADDKLVKTESQKPGQDKRYAFTLKLKAGLVKYKVEFGIKNGSGEKIQQTVSNLVCGDAYIIQGQSNAVAYNYHNNDKRPDLIDFTSDWIRSYGSGGEAGDENATNGGWGNAVITNLKINDRGGVRFIGVWGMVIAKQYVANQKIPICIFNGAVGGTRIDEHMPEDIVPANKKRPIYANLKKRVVEARLTHGIRGVLWHQGEADQGFDGPNNCYGCETYQQYWIDLTAAWKQDYPNIRNYYVYQIYPNACSQGGNRHSDKLRDVQRMLSRQFSSLSVMPTMNLATGASCHFNLEDYEKMGSLMVPLIERDACGVASDKPVTAPDLKKAYFSSDKKDEIVLEFDQAMLWDDVQVVQFYLDGEAGKIISGTTKGNLLKLKLAAPSTAKTITYLTDKKWEPKLLLYGKNGIPALTFCEVEVK